MVSSERYLLREHKTSLIRKIGSLRGPKGAPKRFYGIQITRIKNDSFKKPRSGLIAKVLSLKKMNIIDKEKKVLRGPLRGRLWAPKDLQRSKSKHKRT